MQDPGRNAPKGNHAAKPAPQSHDQVLGLRIRHMRKARGLSLKDLAERAGVSIGLVSQVERGLSSPSVRILASIADALTVSLSSLFEETEKEDPGEGLVVRKHARRRLEFQGTGISKELMTPGSPDARLDLFMIQLDPGGTTGDGNYTHEGEEAGTVLDGLLELTVEGTSYTLSQGDSFRFTSDRPHSFRNPGQTMTRVLWINTRPPS